MGYNFLMNCVMLGFELIVKLVFHWWFLHKRFVCLFASVWDLSILTMFNDVVCELISSVNCRPSLFLRTSFKQLTQNMCLSLIHSLKLSPCHQS